MKKALLLAAGLALLSSPALSQGGSPYNAAGSQAGGPAGGMGRQMGSSKAEDPNMVMPPRGSERVDDATVNPRKNMRKVKSREMRMKRGGRHNHPM